MQEKFRPLIALKVRLLSDGNTQQPLSFREMAN